MRKKSAAYEQSMFAASFRMGMAAGLLMGVALLIMPAHADKMLALASSVAHIL